MAALRDSLPPAMGRRTLPVASDLASRLAPLASPPTSNAQGTVQSMVSYVCSPAESATMDITPRRCQKFKPAPGEKFRWTNTSLADRQLIQSATATADRWGLVTLKNLRVSKAKSRIRISEGP